MEFFSVQGKSSQTLPSNQECCRNPPRLRRNPAKRAEGAVPKVIEDD